MTVERDGTVMSGGQSRQSTGGGLAGGYVVPVAGIVWRVLYSDDQGARFNYTYYEVILYQSRRLIVAAGSGEYCSTTDGDESILQAAGEHKTTRDEDPSLLTTPFSELQGAWVLIEYVHGDINWPVIVGTIPPPYSASWIGNRAKGRRRFSRFSGFEMETTNFGDVIGRLTEPTGWKSVPDQNQNDSPDPDQDPTITIPHRRQREVRLFAADENDPEGLQLHFHKQHFGVKVASAGIDTPTTASRVVKTTLAADTTFHGTEIFVTDDISGPEWPESYYLRVGSEDLPYYAKDAGSSKFILSPQFPVIAGWPAGTEVILLIPSNDPYQSKVKWTNFFGVFGGAVMKIFLGGASTKVCDNKGVLGNILLRVLRWLFGITDKQIIEALLTHGHYVSVPNLITALATPGASFVTGNMSIPSAVPTAADLAALTVQLKAAQAALETVTVDNPDVTDVVAGGLEADVPSTKNILSDIVRLRR